MAILLEIVHFPGVDVVGEVDELVAFGAYSVVPFDVVSARVLVEVVVDQFADGVVDGFDAAKVAPHVELIEPAGSVFAC